jgi:hypothetical protein
MSNAKTPRHLDNSPFAQITDQQNDIDLGSVKQSRRDWKVGHRGEDQTAGLIGCLANLPYVISKDPCVREPLRPGQTPPSLGSPLLPRTLTVTGEAEVGFTRFGSEGLTDSVLSSFEAQFVPLALGSWLSLVGSIHLHVRPRLSAAQPP